jgi:hypothetical protein
MVGCGHTGLAMRQPRRRCHYCPRNADRKTVIRCTRCTRSICPMHRMTLYQCSDCENKSIGDSIDLPTAESVCHLCVTERTKCRGYCVTCKKPTCALHRSEVLHCLTCNNNIILMAMFPWKENFTAVWISLSYLAPLCQYKALLRIEIKLTELNINTTWHVQGETN